MAQVHLCTCSLAGCLHLKISWHSFSPIRTADEVINIFLQVGVPHFLFVITTSMTQTFISTGHMLMVSTQL